MEGTWLRTCPARRRGKTIQPEKRGDGLECNCISKAQNLWNGNVVRWMSL
jgi:hypothetical protein